MSPTALGISLAHRSKLLAGIPTIAEQGLSRFGTSTFRGIVASAGTPPAIIEARCRDCEIAEHGERRSADGSEAISNTPEEFKQFIADDVAR